MDEPVTELDPRFSDPSAEATPWSTARAELEGAQLAWLSTVRADGRPHVTPLVAVWLDGAIHFCTGPGEQKAVNLSTNRHVVLTTGCNQWDRGLDVVVEGEARPVTDRVTLERLSAVWATKWDGRWRFGVSDGGFEHEAGTALVFAVEPSKVLAFGKGEGFSHTRHLPAR
jgi:general stress protein 26